MGNKKYYWLKLKDNFFTQKEIKRLRRIAGGDTYTIIYLKLLLLSLKSEGKIYFDNIGDSFEDEISLEIDEEPDNVKVTINYLKQKGLLEIISNDEIYLNEVQALTGSESDSAERVRKYRRAKNKEEKEMLQSNGGLLQCNSDVTKCNTEIEIEIEKEIKKDIDIVKAKKSSKHKYGEYNNVLLSDEELDKLKAEFPNDWQQRVERVSEYSASTGKTYKNYLATIRNWAKKEGNYGKPKGNNGTSSNTGGASEESLRLERIAKEQGLINPDGSVEPVGEVDF